MKKDTDFAYTETYRKAYLDTVSHANYAMVPPLEDRTKRKTMWAAMWTWDTFAMPTHRKLFEELGRR